MKVATLLLLRVSTGMMLVIWGLFRVQNVEGAKGLSERYYPDFLAGENLMVAWGSVQIIIGVLVILGLLRKISYPAQALALFLGAVLIWKHLVDPFDLFLFPGDAAPSKVFFASLALFAATLAVIAFKEDDAWSMDRKLALPF